MTTHQDYLNSGFAENTIPLDRYICTQNIGVTYEYDIPWRQIKIIQHLVSQKIRLRRTSILSIRTLHEDRPRLLEIFMRRKYDYAGPHCLYPEHNGVHRPSQPACPGGRPLKCTGGKIRAVWGQTVEQTPCF